MAYKALYRKYRPEAFSDVVGQEHITKTLQQQLSSGKLFHAYLFTGTRGTGKTTCAKILAKAVNCLNPIDGDPCGQCEACKAIEGENATDIVEMDAASNNGVEYIRELREQINFTPASLKYRVYIIDEVHMLSIGAFNALLKTLEEPPAHVVFILATTEVHKLPSTILSRCQRFDFHRIAPEVITGRIKQVAEKEGISITCDAADMIAAIADGGMRDALSTLDLCAAASSEITEETVEHTCGMASGEYLLKMANHIINRNSSAAITLLNEVYNSSVDMLRFLNDLILHFRNLMIIKTVKTGGLPIVCSPTHLEALRNQAEGVETETVMATLRLMQDTLPKMQSGNRRTELELALLKACSPEIRVDSDALLQRISLLESRLNGISQNALPPIQEQESSTDIKIRTKSAPMPAAQVEAIAEDEFVPPIEDEATQADEVLFEALPEATAPPADSETNRVDDISWASVISELSKSAPLLGGILHGSSAYIDGSRLLVDSQNPQFADMMNSPAGNYRDKLRAAVLAVLGKSYSLGPYKKPSAEAEDPLNKLRDKLKVLEVPKS